MPALDAGMTTAETTFNIDGSTAYQATAAVNLGKGGLPKNLYCTVLITEASAANFNAGSTRTARADFEYTTDNGTSWRKGGSTEFLCNASGLAKQIKSFPINHDIVPEQHSASDIDWRVNFVLSANFAATNADNFNFQGYLGGPTGEPALQDQI